jgi:hypothetical protein
MPAKGFLTQSQKDNLQKALKESDACGGLRLRSQLTQKILMLLLYPLRQTRSPKKNNYYKLECEDCDSSAAQSINLFMQNFRH